MSTKANTAKIGVFVILAVALLVAGLLAFGAKSYFVTKIKLETAIDGEVYGLSEGSGVQLRGVPVGKVTRITFAWDVYPESKTNLIIVEFEVEEVLLPLPPGMDVQQAVDQSTARGMRALIKSQGITGTSILALEQLDPEAYPPPKIDYKPHHYYIPSAPSQLTRLVESIEKSLSHLQEVNFESIGQGVTNTLASIHRLSEKLTKIDFGAVSTNANALLQEIRETNIKLTATIGDVQKKFNGMKLDAVSRNANDLISDLRETNVKLQSVLDKVGTVPMQQTVTDLQQVFQNLNDVLGQIKDYPSGFIFGKPPQPVEGLQPAGK